MNDPYYEVVLLFLARHSPAKCTTARRLATQGHFRSMARLQSKIPSQLPMNSNMNSDAASIWDSSSLGRFLVLSKKRSGISAAPPGGSLKKFQYASEAFAGLQLRC
jgi:hypothetical protein